MKKLILPITILFVFFACSSNSEKKETNAFKKGAIEVITSFPNIIKSIKLTYGKHNLITNADRKVNNYNEAQVICKYNNLDVPSKFEFYFDNSLSHYKIVNCFTDSLHFTKFTILDKDTTENYRETYVYNQHKEMTNIIRYRKDSLGLWQKRGSKYDFEWENGNMVLIKCYVPVEYTTYDSIVPENEIDNKSLFELEELTNEIIKTGYTLYYKSKYTYDNKNNPFKNLSLSQFILPNELNISTNNPIAIKKTYSEGEEINFLLDYEYNDLGYPIMTDINVTSNIEGIEKAHYTREFKY